MQQSATDRLVQDGRVRFGVDLGTTDASYRQALWGTRPAPPVVTLPVAAPTPSAPQATA